jgi:endonuclease/exonuclease/phosphatase (EEP) superfamily protein YafD
MISTFRRNLTRPRLYKPLPDGAAVRLGTPSLPALGAHITVVCWNVFKVIRAGALADLAALSTEADLVLLQEAVLHGGQPHPLHLSVGHEWLMAQTAAHPGRAVSTGPKTGCRAPALASTWMRSPDYEPIVGTPKASLLTRYAMDDDILTVINVHAVNFVPLAKFARQIAQIAGLIGDQSGPLLVGGDFNTWNPGRYRLVMRVMAEAGLHRVPVTAPRRWRHLGQQLDHVFTRGLKLIEARPLAHIVSSDHIPLRMEFERATAAAGFGDRQDA